MSDSTGDYISSCEWESSQRSWGDYMKKMTDRTSIGSGGNGSEHEDVFFWGAGREREREKERGKWRGADG